MSSFQEEMAATPARRASGASATSSRKSGASFGSAVSDYSYHDSEEESPLKEVYDDEKNLAEAIKASETEAQYDRIAKQLEGVAIDEEAEVAATPEEIAASKAALSLDLASEAGSEVSVGDEDASEAAAPSPDAASEAAASSPDAASEAGSEAGSAVGDVARPLADSNASVASRGALHKGNKRAGPPVRALVEN